MHSAIFRCMILFSVFQGDHVLSLYLSDGLLLKSQTIGERTQKGPFVYFFAEKIRPLDVKLKNQVDKLVRAAARNEVRSAGGADPLQFRPNPEGLVDKVRGPVVSGANGLSVLSYFGVVYLFIVFFHPILYG